MKPTYEDVYQTQHPNVDEYLRHVQQSTLLSAIQVSLTPNMFATRIKSMYADLWHCQAYKPHIFRQVLSHTQIVISAALYERWLIVDLTICPGLAKLQCASARYANGALS